VTTAFPDALASLSAGSDALFYTDLVMAALSLAARKALEAQMIPEGWEPRSELFKKHWDKQGPEGVVEGERLAVLKKHLRTRVRRALRGASAERVWLNQLIEPAHREDPRRAPRLSLLLQGHRETHPLARPGLKPRSAAGSYIRMRECCGTLGLIVSDLEVLGERVAVSNHEHFHI
jgi:hypothetical protein